MCGRGERGVCVMSELVEESHTLVFSRLDTAAAPVGFTNTHIYRQVMIQSNMVRKGVSVSAYLDVTSACVLQEFCLRSSGKLEMQVSSLCTDIHTFFTYTGYTKVYVTPSLSVKTD